MIQLNLKPWTLALSLALILTITMTSCHQDSSSHYVKNGSAKYQLQNYNGAIADLDKAIELQADNAEAYYLRALCFAIINESEKAAADFDKTIFYKTDYKEAYFNRAFYIYQKSGEYQKAIDDYNTFLSLKPTKFIAFALNNRGWSEYKLGMFNDALTDIDHSIKKNPENVLAYKNRALVLYAMESFDDACVSYKKAIAMGFSVDEKEPLLDSLNLRCDF